MNTSQAHEYAALGYGVFAVQPLGKAPATRNGLKDATTDPTRISRWAGHHNIGIVPPERVLVLDADTSDEVERLEREHPELRHAPRQDTPSGGAHIWTLLPDGVTPPKTSTKVQGRALDLRGLGKSYLVAEPSTTPKGSYRWTRPLVRPDQLPETPSGVLALLPSPEKPTTTPPKPAPPLPQEGNRERRYAQAALQHEYDAVASAAPGSRNHALNRAAYSLGQLVGAGALEHDEVEDALRGAARTCGLEASETETTLKSGLEAGIAAPREMPEKSRVATRAATQRGGVGAPTGDTDPPPDLLKQPRTDYGAAERLQALYGRRFRYCAALGFIVWDGQRWGVDEGESTMRRLALKTARELFAQAARLEGDQREAWVKHSLALERGGALKAAVELAKSIPGVTISVEELDADPMLLNVENGTLNLGTGKLKDHDPRDLITKLAPVTFDPSAECVRWLEFQRTICAGDDDLIAFKQRAFGYSATGNASEHCLFIPYGTGANGKSTELDTVGALLGDYANTAQFDSFAVKKNEGVRDDIADLMGARFISASEGENRQRLAEGLIKQMTGGDTLKARRLYGAYFRFKPTFKLWLATNHKPVIKGVDEGIWRRIKLIPYAVTIPAPQRDKKLKEKLEAERSGILNWMLEGCRLWLENGLGEAEAVREATEDYRQESDVLAEFITARCVIDPLYSESAGDLYRAYVDWCRDNSEEPLTSTTFGKMLSDRQYDRDQERRGNKVVKVRKGICLRENALDRGEV